MMITFLRLITMFAISIITGILGVIWFFGSNPSIWMTIGVKPLAVILLFISYIFFELTRGEIKKIEKRNSQQVNKRLK